MNILSFKVANQGEAEVGARLHGMARLRDAATELPSNVFRAKGLVHLRERSDRACVLQVVGRRARIDLGTPWGDEPPRTELVFLGRGDIDPEAIEAALRQCTEPPSRPTVMHRAIAWVRARWQG